MVLSTAGKTNTRTKDGACSQRDGVSISNRVAKADLSNGGHLSRELKEVKGVTGRGENKQRRPRSDRLITRVVSGPHSQFKQYTKT